MFLSQISVDRLVYFINADRLRWTIREYILVKIIKIVFGGLLDRYRSIIPFVLPLDDGSRNKAELLSDRRWN